jgi:hypothetical protein
MPKDNSKKPEIPQSDEHIAISNNSWDKGMGEYYQTATVKKLGLGLESKLITEYSRVNRGISSIVSAKHYVYVKALQSYK